MALLLDEQTYGPKAKDINELVERLTSLNWYRSIGEKNDSAERALDELLQLLQVDQYTVEWVSKSNLNNVLPKIELEGSTVWEKLKDVPDELKEKVDKFAQNDLLKIAVDPIQEVIFHSVFEAAYKTFKEEKLVQFFVGQAMYFAVLIFTAALANEKELSNKLLNILELGHIPVGLNGMSVYML